MAETRTSTQDPERDVPRDLHGGPAIAAKAWISMG
jgi:hypothetical protein